MNTMITSPIATSEAHVDACLLVSSAPNTISQLLSNGEFYEWQSELISSGGYARSGSDSRDRYNRCYDAAESGSDGSTHAEHIDDFRAYAEEVYRDINRKLSRLCLDIPDELQDALQDVIDERQAELASDCDACENWHAKNNSLNQQIG